MELFELPMTIARIAKHAFKLSPTSKWNVDKMLDERCHKTPDGLAVAYLDER